MSNLGRILSRVFQPAALIWLLSASAAPAADLAPEFHVRGGLPNIAAKAQAGEEERVAFLGGSITAAERDNLTRFRRNQQPQDPTWKRLMSLSAT